MAMNSQEGSIYSSHQVSYWRRPVFVAEMSKEPAVALHDGVLATERLVDADKGPDQQEDAVEQQQEDAQRSASGSEVSRPPGSSPVRIE